MLRRWRVVVIDDNPEGSLEAVLLSPLVVGQPLPMDASQQQIASAVANNLLNRYLPLEKGELYACEADVDFQIRDFATRRAECAPRFPIVEVERDFVRAWRLVGELAENPPDIVFLDVMFDQKTTAKRDVEAIIDELHGKERIAKSGRPTIREILLRGGLFLLGKLLRSRGQVQQMPLIVLYSASRDVQADFRPFEYASDGRFEVVVKRDLRNDAEQRKQVFRRRIRDYFMDGTVRPDDVRAAVTLLGAPEAIAGDHDTLMKAFRYDIGSGWCFGSLFAAETVAYLSKEPSRRHAVVDELEKFIAPLVSDARSFADLMALSPARLFSHSENTRITFSRRPVWLDASLGEEVSGTNLVRIALKDLNGDLVSVRGELEMAIRRLPQGLRNRLGGALEPVINSKTPGAALDKLIHSFSGHNEQWEDLLASCRMTMPAAEIAEFLLEAACDDLDLQFINEDPLTGEWDHVHKLELLLAPSGVTVKEPLATLLQAILKGMRRYGYEGVKGAARVQYGAIAAPSTMQISITDEGSGFPDLRYYDPTGRGGDLSTALLAASEWFEIEIHSGGVKRRPTLRGAGVAEPSNITHGTQFVIRIPAYRLEV